MREHRSFSFSLLSWTDRSWPRLLHCHESVTLVDWSKGNKQELERLLASQVTVNRTAASLAELAMGACLVKSQDQQVGEGTFATVCVVADEAADGQAFAVKRLKRQSSVEEVGLFNKEIDVLSSMDHQ